MKRNGKRPELIEKPKKIVNKEEEK